MRWRQYLKRLFAPGNIAVLMYHRIATPETDPWQLAVSPENFEAHVKWLKKNCVVITPQQLLKERPRKRRRKNCVCITFDDGYLDNYTTAKPLLEKYRCSASFFITTYGLQTGKPFWWDELQEIILSTPTLPSPFSFAVGNERIALELENNGKLNAEQKALQANWVWSDAPPTQRCRLYYWLWERMRCLPQAEIEALLQKLKSVAGIGEVNMRDVIPMTIADLRDMSRNPLLQVGLHTHTHPVLSEHTAGIQRKELEENKTLLEQTCGYGMTTLSYPHGRYNKDTLVQVEQMGLAAAFTTKADIVTPQSPVHELGRFQVLNWSADEFKSALQKIFRR